MRSRQRSGFIFSVFLVASLAGGHAGAQGSSAKRELAVELLRATGGADMAQQITSILLSSMRQSYSSMVSELIASQPSLSPDERIAVAEHLSDYDRFARRYSARIAKEVDFEAILQQVYVPLYEKYFTEDELREILAFQTSPVGQKAAALMPHLMQEGMAATMPLVQPAVIAIAGEVLREEQAIALRQLR